MSNGIKRSHSSESRRWLTVALSSVGLAVLTCALPLPSTFGELLRAGPAQAAAGGPAGAAVLVVASCLVWPLLVWGCAVLLLGAATRLPGGAGRSAVRALRRVLPAALRPMLVAGLGVSIGVGTIACGTTGSTTAATSHARAAAPEGDAAARADVAGRAVAGLQLDWPATPAAAIAIVTTLPELDWPVSSAPASSQPSSPAAQPHPSPSGPAHRTDPRPAARTRAGAPARSPVTVRPGDTLWAIAAAHLPAGAGDTQIDRTWRAWYSANAMVIGPDPNLIQPGQQLLPPTTKDAS